MIRQRSEALLDRTVLLPMVLQRKGVRLEHLL